MLEINKIHQGDCMELMKEIPDASVDMILCDLPYGITQNKWDSPLDLSLLWAQYTRIIKERGLIVLTAQTPFDKILGASNIKMLRYEWIWEKDKAGGFLNANKMPMKAHENILVFYKRIGVYNPQKTTGHKPSNKAPKEYSVGKQNYREYNKISTGGQTDRFPRTVIKFNVVNSQSKEFIKEHKTQKPVELFEYLIKTYSNEGDLVLDNCIGSGTTAIACKNLKRNFIGIELEQKYVEIANKRLELLQSKY